MPSQIELARLAAATNILRPDWPTRSLQTILERDHHTRPYHDLAVALTWIATDPDTHTPARLNEPGPWWTALNTSTTPGPPKYDPEEFAEMRRNKAPMPPDFADRIRAGIEANRRPSDTTRRDVDRDQLEQARAELDALRPERPDPNNADRTEAANP